MCPHLVISRVDARPSAFARQTHGFEIALTSSRAASAALSNRPHGLNGSSALDFVL